MGITIEQARHVARLARLALSEEELGRYAGQLGAILGYAAQLDELDTTGVAPAPYPYPMELPLRADRCGASLPVEEVLAMAPDQGRGCVRVPRVLPEEDG
ncbi:MAG: Asp-tRNA(Asn)/Glu-tRNA(Gln) amidotransferase subunit GatC [Deltaproteobacteria bacterium]|nr:Asp-tRNA(Asn)/Glu-tRNA(Gln) amidotransferase subunit GatC [Deltaproteobacteria bacterium]